MCAPGEDLEENGGSPIRKPGPPTSHETPAFSENTPMDVEVLSADRSFLDMLRPLLQDLNFPSRPPDVDATSVCIAADL